MSAAPATGADDQEAKPISQEALEKGLMVSLGDSFEYLGGEVGQTRAIIGSRLATRFWFAKVRPKVAGQFAVSYTIKFDFPGEAKRNGRMPERAAYTLPIIIGKLDAPRIIHARAFGGSAFPHANVGDTVIVPIHVDQFTADHTFSAFNEENRYLRAFFSIRRKDYMHDKFIKLASVEPVVRNSTGDLLELLATWDSSSFDRPLINMHHSLKAYMEFKKPGEFNLESRLANPGEKPVREDVAIRVVPKDKPVVVLLEQNDYTEYREIKSPLTVRSSGSVPGGTIEARVGDRILVECGRYTTPVKEKLKALRQSEVVTHPFMNVNPYSPEPKK